MSLEVVFEYFINDEKFISIKASAKDVDSLEAEELLVYYPKYVSLNSDQKSEIRDMAVEKLCELKEESGLVF